MHPLYINNHGLHIMRAILCLLSIGVANQKPSIECSFRVVRYSEQSLVENLTLLSSQKLFHFCSTTRWQQMGIDGKRNSFQRLQPVRNVRKCYQDDKAGTVGSFTYEAKGRTFESCRTHFNINDLGQAIRLALFLCDRFVT
jgi:hypothetical protein